MFYIRSQHQRKTAELEHYGSFQFDVESSINFVIKRNGTLRPIPTDSHGNIK